MEIDWERVRDLLCCAFEGGSNYWYEIGMVSWPEGYTREDYREGGKGQTGGSYYHWSQLVPTQEGGALHVSSKARDEIGGKRVWILDREACARGLSVMAEKCAWHHADFVAGNEDACTGDVFLQCALFSEVVFG